MISIQEHIILSSDPNNGAININQNKNEFDIDLTNQNIIIPTTAVSCTLHVNDCEFIYNFPNIKTGVNDNIRILYTDSSANDYEFNLTIPQGLYLYQELSNEIGIQLINEVGYPEENSLIELIGNDPQQKILIKYNYANIRVDLSGNTTFRDLIGFNSGLYPISGPSSGSNTFDIAQNIAKFNQIEYVILSCDLVDNGINLNDQYEFYISRIPITTGIGQQQIYTPNYENKINCSNLIGKKLSRTRVRLLDQNGIDIDTNSENFSAHIIIEYLIPEYEIKK